MIRRPPRSTLFPYTTSSDLDRTVAGSIGSAEHTSAGQGANSGERALDSEQGIEAANRLKRDTRRTEIQGPIDALSLCC